MGVSWYISLERKIPGFNELDVDGKSLAHASDELDAIAKELTVASLLCFFDAPLDQMMDLFGEEAVEGLEPREPRWFPASEGLALIKYVQSRPEAVSGPDRVLRDLKDFERILERADADGVRWHLSADV